MFIRNRKFIKACFILTLVFMIVGIVNAQVFEKAREKAQQAECMSNLKQLSLGAMMYSSDHDGKLPDSNKWQSQLYPYTKNKKLFKCTNKNVVYAFNKKLSGLNLNKIKNPSEVILFFEVSKNLKNASGGRADAMLPHNGLGNFAYADGHVRSLSQVPDKSYWVPKYESPKPVSRIPVKKK